jgi:SAM-dependent methyltransferase
MDLTVIFSSRHGENKMDFEDLLICPDHGELLEGNEAGIQKICPRGCSFPKIRRIYRFVENEKYASSFGLQWNYFRQTQLDSFTGLTISKDRLTRIAGGSLGIFRNQFVLEAGCGAGRFTEILLDAGAFVFAVDISNAVDANFQNFGHHPNLFLCQADILKVPVAPESFDIVVCIGVIQHTPSPEKTIESLCAYVKPGGILLVDHYAWNYPLTATRRWLRKFLLQKEPGFSMRFVQQLTGVLWPIHKILYRLRNVRGFRRIRRSFVSFSPIVDYQDAYPMLGTKLHYQWAVLDTHDTLTDYYKHFRSADEIRDILLTCGMIDVSTIYAGNGVEARARKPMPRKS